MAEERVQRRLSAILAADVVGYSRQMEADEAGTLERLKAVRREVFVPTITQFGGRVFKLTGDGAFVEFGSAVDAVNSAVAIQKSLTTKNASAPEDQRVELRIGISLGDVIVEGRDLYGNGVNIAARLEGLAEPGEKFAFPKTYTSTLVMRLDWYLPTLVISRSRI
jgi:adenylate cyclase